MREDKKDHFLMNMEEELSSDKTYIETPELKKDSKKTEEIIINNDTIKLSNIYNNTNKLESCLDTSTDKIIKLIKKVGAKENVYSYSEKCFLTFKTYLKDIVNLCYYDIELEEKYMDLVYQLIFNNMLNLNNALIKNANEYTGEMNELARETAETQENIKRQEMIDYINSPTLVTTNTYEGGLFTDSTSFSMAFKMGKPPQLSNDNFYGNICYNASADYKKEYFTGEAYKIVKNSIIKFNEQFKKFLYEKVQNLFSKEKTSYTLSDTWLNYILECNEKEYENISKCINFFDIDIKEEIENIIVDNCINYEESDEKYLNFYKYINNGKDINISNKLVDSFSEIISEKLDETAKIEGKKKILDKEIESLKTINYLKENDIKLIISNTEKEISSFKDDLDLRKKEKKKALIKKLLIILSFLLGFGLLVLLCILIKGFLKWLIIAVMVVLILYYIYDSIFK